MDFVHKISLDYTVAVSLLMWCVSSLCYHAIIA